MAKKIYVHVRSRDAGKSTDASAVYSKGKFELRSIVGGFAVFVNGKKFDTFPKGAGGEAQGRRRVDELAQQEAEHQAWLKSQGA